MSEKGKKKVVKIDDIDHLQETFYGASGVFSLEEMIEKIDIEIYSEDRINVFPEPRFGLGSVITITRATPVKIIDAGYETVYRTWQTKVSELFEEINIKIDDEDQVSVDLNEKLVYDIEIVITRVSLSEIKEYEQIEYDVVYQDDSTMEKGLKKVSQYPEYGKRELTYMIRAENGKEIYRNLVNTKVVEEPVNKIILIGTKVVVLGQGSATWYDWISGMTAASNVLPYGTKVLVRASNGKEVIVTIIDHGIKGGAIIDLSVDAFSKLAPLGAGRISVVLEKP